MNDPIRTGNCKCHASEGPILIFVEREPPESGGGCVVYMYLEPAAHRALKTTRSDISGHLYRAGSVTGEPYGAAGKEPGALANPLTVLGLVGSCRNGPTIRLRGLKGGQNAAWK